MSYEEEMTAALLKVGSLRDGEEFVVKDLFDGVAWNRFETSYHFVKNFFRATRSAMTPTVELARPGRPLPSGDGPPHRTR